MIYTVIFLLIHYVYHIKVQFNDVIKSIGWYWAFVMLPIQTNIAENNTDTDTDFSISASLIIIPPS